MGIDDYGGGDGGGEGRGGGKEVQVAEDDDEDEDIDKVVKMTGEGAGESFDGSIGSFCSLLGTNGGGPESIMITHDLLQWQRQKSGPPAP